MLAHYHGQLLNTAELARAFGVSDKTARHYIDILAATYMVRQLPPWFENLAKRQVKAPKFYFRDSGLLHYLLGVADTTALWQHPKVGASWEGFALEQALRLLRPDDASFWATHNGAELDLMAVLGGRRLGFEARSRPTRASPPASSASRLRLAWPANGGQFSGIGCTPPVDVEGRQSPENRTLSTDMTSLPDTMAS